MSSPEVSDCPFCNIAQTYQPIPPNESTAWQCYESQTTTTTDSSQPPSSPTAYVLLSTPHALAFLDILPLTRGHVLVTPRGHRAKMGDLKTDEAAELGRILPLVARAVIRAVLPDIPVDEADYNIVQNNGAGAAQVVPHMHFHIIPRPPLDYKNTSPTTHRTPTRAQMQSTIFGRGQRTDLDDDEAAELIVTMRSRIAEEWDRAFSVPPKTSDTGEAGGASLTVAGAKSRL